MTWAATPEAAYRPLRPASLAVQLVVLLIGEVLIYRSYSGYDALFHYSTHLLVGLLAAAVVLLGYLLLGPSPLEWTREPPDLSGDKGWVRHDVASPMSTRLRR